MAATIPASHRRTLQFAHGTALGISNRWQQGQYCSILTEAGIVGCGIYDLQTAAEFGQAIAIARGTPANPLTEPEDLFEAKIVGATPKARSYGIEPGMTGQQAVELLLKASGGGRKPGEAPPPLEVLGLDHVTLVVADLERSRQFYCGVLGMKNIERPGFSFPGLWFQAGSTQIHLILEHPESAPAGFPAPPDYASPGRTFHFAFEVRDASQVAAILTAHGVPLKGQPRLRPDGCLQVFCLDPDGHVVEVFSRPRA
jgi:catechol 2,3-dioxygenase-like lactoylglutathione lyase family enzyme/uncharacterized protein YunC (DUF1805 family)